MMKLTKPTADNQYVWSGLTLGQLLAILYTLKRADERSELSHVGREVMFFQMGGITEPEAPVTTIKEPSNPAKPFKKGQDKAPKEGKTKLTRGLKAVYQGFVLRWRPHFPRAQLPWERSWE